jgi:hypothetical protein
MPLACLLACLLAEHDVRVIQFVKLFYTFPDMHPKHPARERRGNSSNGMRGIQKGVKHGERLFSRVMKSDREYARDMPVCQPMSNPTDDAGFHQKRPDRVIEK